MSREAGPELRAVHFTNPLESPHRTLGPLALPAIADSGHSGETRLGRSGEEDDVMMFGYGSHTASWEVALIWIGMVAFMALVIWAAYSIVRGGTQRGFADDNPARSGELLDQRLARGDIGADEYQRLRELLSSHDSDPVDTGIPQ